MSLRLMKRIGKIVYKFLSAFLIAFVFFACGPLPQEQEAESAVGITAPDGYSISCATNFSRTTPHLCIKTTVPSSSVLTLDNTCRNVDLVATHGYVATGKARLGYSVSILSANAVAVREVNTIFYTDSGCTVQSNLPQFLFRAYEQVALTAREIFLYQVTPFDITTNASGVIYYKGTACASCSGIIYGLGYYD